MYLVLRLGGEILAVQALQVPQVPEGKGLVSPEVSLVRRPALVLDLTLHLTSSSYPQAAMQTIQVRPSLPWGWRTAP